MSDATSTNIARVDKAAAGEGAPRVRSISQGPWTGVELGELFSKGHFIAARHSDIVRVSVSLACWEVISQDVSKTPLELRRRTRNGSVLVQPEEHPVADLLWRRPSVYYGWREWLRMAGAYLAAARIYYAAARRTRTGRVLEVQGVPSGQVETLMNVEAGRYFYRVWPQTDHDQIQWSWMSEPLSSDDIVPMRLRSLNGIDPIGNADVAREALDLLGKMNEYQSNTFKGGGVGVVAVTFPDGLADEQYARLKNDFQQAFEKARVNGTPILFEGSGGVVPEVKRLSMSAVDQDFVKSNVAAMHEVLRYYRMPPTKVGIYENVKYDNIDPINRAYVDDTLVPVFECIEDALDQLLVSSEADADLFFRFDRDFAYAQDPKTRNEIVTSQWKAGLLELDEARAKQGLNTYGGKAGQTRMISGNFVLVDRQNKVVMRAGGNAPGAEGDQAPQDEAGANAGKELPEIGHLVPDRLQ
ncbi:phage portal protein [Mangrovibrevibacter kandeliae]|uniref:phage portal protein n=1 Tax=Mangrovibrevibacter kandeliae TaxID=2968473 RepID=UPI0021194D65|nr:phage portal protein [Aurantimonas sp. CSK15Z-1]MCQ8781712.1 phage portal protein [Aurantimonas sp. CSK15Z-1]